MLGLSYERLTKVTNTVPHYRGNKDRFPLFNRRENRKYFLVREEDGQRVFDIVYGVTWERHDLTKEEFEAMEAKGEKTAAKYAKYDGNGKETGEYEYSWYETMPNVIGTVRSDNTFEFNATRYGQGDRTVMSSLSRGWFSTDSRRGGMVYRNGQVLHPIYRGMKVDVETMQPSVPYEVVIHHVNRKAAKDLLSKYEHFYKVSEVMLKAMTVGMVIETAKEVVTGIWGEEGRTKYRADADYMEQAEKLINDAPLDAFVLYCLANNIGRIGYRLWWDNPANDESNAYEDLFVSLKRVLNKGIYRQHRDIFKEVNCVSGSVYPACDWGTKILVDGKEMEQYT